ncbi:unnamed protein product [Coregonus sp. 'balchen']|nr:unnamed protein product [Coregonus sp. 'balchen']
MDGEMVVDPEREERGEEKNNIKVGEKVLKEEVDEYLMNKMLMLEQLSGRFCTLDKTGVKPGERVEGTEEGGENERERDMTGESAVERDGEKVGEKEDQTETETRTSPRPQNVDERKEPDQTKNETSQEMEEEKSERVERGGYEGGKVEDKASKKEIEILGEREEDHFGKNTDKEEIETERYSAVSLRSITTEVLKVLNATEDLLQGVEGDDYTTSLSPNTDTKRLDEQLSKLEENVYMVAGTAYGLEAELGDLEECARAIGSATSDLELYYLEEQVATAAAQVSDITTRIAALKIAGLNIIKKPKPD